MDDLISRQAAIDAIRELCQHYTPTKSTFHPHVDFVIWELEYLPCEDVAPVKHGKWIYNDDDNMRYDTYHCSVCRKLFTVDAERLDDIGFVKDDLKYCPNCGARMVGDSE